MLKHLLAMTLLLTAVVAQGATEEAVVIEVRKKIKLHDLERTYADYFIRGGSKLGLSEGVLVSVVRRVPVHDPFDNASVGDFHVKVADVEIIHVDDQKAIGRLVEIDRRAARPMLAYDAIMIGDRLDLTTMRAKVAHREAPSSVFDQPREPASAPAPAAQGASATEVAPVVDIPQEPEENQEISSPELTNP